MGGRLRAAERGAARVTTARPLPELAIGEAAITAIGDLTAAQLLSAITPEQVGELTGYSASSVRYRLNAAGRRDSARGWSFDREQLLASALRAHQARARSAWPRLERRAVGALDDLEAGRSGAAEAALAELLTEMSGGEPTAATGGEPWHRLYLLAAAAAPTSPLIAGLLRELDNERRRRLRPLTARALAVLGREPLPDAKLDALGDALSAYLTGVAARRRADPGVQVAVPPAALALILGLSQPNATGPAAPASALIQALTTG